MSIGRSSSTSRFTPGKEELASDTIRALVAEYLGVGIERVTEEARFAEDFGVDWLDRLEIMMIIEDRFAGIEITDDHIDRIESVGELVRLIQNAGRARTAYGRC